MPVDEVQAEALIAALQRGRSSIPRTSETRLAELRRTIDEAAAWCAHFLDRNALGTCLRPAGLAPSPLWRDRWDAVAQVVYHRAADVRVLGLERGPARGRLLVYFPDAELCDGAAAVESGELFDDHNAPPWGTWLGYFEDGGDPSYGSYLLAWVPEAIVADAEAGIAVNPEECIAWLDATRVRLAAITALLDVA